MSTDLKKKLVTPIVLIGSALMVVGTLMLTGAPPFSAPGFEDISHLVILPGAMLTMVGALMMRQRECQRSEEDAEATQGA